MVADLESGKEIDENTELRPQEQKNDCYTKEELLELSNTPGWNAARKVLLGLFWLLWFAMIAWSVVIVINAPKCKKEPSQAWFTEGAIASLDCAGNDLDSVKTLGEKVESGQYKAIKGENCIPAIKDLDSVSDDQKALTAEVCALAKSKDMKCIIALDSVDTEDFSAEIFEKVKSTISDADGFILKNAGDTKISINSTEALLEKDLFVEGQETIPENAFYYRRLSDKALEEAQDWIRKTMKFNETTENVDTPVWTLGETNSGIETLWEAETKINDKNNQQTAQYVLSSVLPGGFVAIGAENDGFGKLAKEWRDEFASLRAIDGSVMRWFPKSQGLSRKFDIQCEVEIVLNEDEIEVQLDSVRGISENREQIFPAAEEDAVKVVNILQKGDALVFKNC